MRLISALLTTLIILIINHHPLQAQQKKLGDISVQELQMTAYEKDSTANAVVLFDVGDVYVDENLEVYFTRHVRIKVLTDNGLSFGDISIPFRNTDPKQKIKSIKAESYHLNEKGKIKKNKLGRRDKFTDKVSDNWSQIKFTVPGLRKGSVFEYSYRMESTSPIDIPDWYFQKEIPVAWSEYKLQIPEWFNYTPYQRSYYDFEISQQKSYQGVARLNYTVVNQGGYMQPDRRSNRTQRIDYLGTEYHYAMKDVPALSDEPYMKSRNDYRAQVQFQLASYQFPGGLLNNVLDSWASLTNAFDDYENFGKRLKSYSTLRKKTEEITADSETDLQKMISIYNHISSVMKWDETYSVYAYKNLDEVYEAGTGNSSEINLLLIQMLKDAGLQAEPVIISTRGNGEIISIYPLADQFNHTLARVKVGGKAYLLDAKDDHRHYSILPANNLNGRGLVIKEGAYPEWVDLVNQTPNKLVHVINAEITPDGSVAAKVQSKYDGYLSHIYKESLDENKLDTDILNFFTETENLTVDSVKVMSKKNDKSFMYEAGFQYNFQTEGDIRYINPMMFEKLSENPFKKEKRAFPVDFNYTFNKSMIINYSLPEGWAVEELPESKVYQLSKRGGVYSRVIQMMGDNLISIRYNFTIVRTRFMPDEYEGLRLFFDAVVQDHNDRIIIKKI